MSVILITFLNLIAERFLQVQNLRSLWIVQSMICNLLMRLLRILVLDSILLILKFELNLITTRWSCWSLFIMQIMRLQLLSLVCFQSPNQLQHLLLLLNQHQLQLPNLLKIRDIVTVVPVLLDITGTTDTILIKICRGYKNEK